MVAREAHDPQQLLLLLLLLVLLLLLRGGHGPTRLGSGPRSGSDRLKDRLLGSRTLLFLLLLLLLLLLLFPLTLPLLVQPEHPGEVSLDRSLGPVRDCQVLVATLIRHQ
jgi:hypothetical protein